jgi:hypothetical protein
MTSTGAWSGFRAELHHHPTWEFRQWSAPHIKLWFTPTHLTAPLLRPPESIAVGELPTLRPLSLNGCRHGRGGCADHLRKLTSEVTNFLKKL